MGLPFDQGVVPVISAHLAVGIVGSFLVARFVDDAFLFPAKRDVAADEAIGGVAEFRLGDEVVKPSCLFGAELFEGDSATEAGVGVGFIFTGVEADDGDGSAAESIEGAPIWGGDHFGNAIGPLAPDIMIAPDKKHRASVADVLPGGVEEGRGKPLFFVPVVADVTVPDEEVPFWCDVVEPFECFVVFVGVIPNHEGAFRRRRTESAKLFPGAFLADFAIRGFGDRADFVVGTRGKPVETDTEDFVSLRAKSISVDVGYAGVTLSITPLDPSAREGRDGPDDLDAIGSRSHQDSMTFGQRGFGGVRGCCQGGTGGGCD